MKIVRVINENGYLVDEVDIDNPLTAIEQGCEIIEQECSQGFYHPKWDFETEQWIEGGSHPEVTPEQQIAQFKTELQSTDYKIIKCSEYQLAGQELPYDIAELHAQRQALRDSINALEEILNSSACDDIAGGDIVE